MNTVTSHVGPADPAPTRSSTSRGPRLGYRPDIEGLRAVAIGLVLIYHAGLPWIPGGFIGVDVFFVISGFLITGVILREVAETGRLSLVGFYARRAKRLLPATVAVLVTTAVLTVVFLPVSQRAVFGGDIAAAAGYIVNWRLADRAVDYLAEDAGSSPVQHFWSLAVEEQFYVVWPVLIVVILAVGRLARRGSQGKSQTLALGLGLAAIAIPSFLWALHLTPASPNVAFFVTTTRLWELGVGAAVALSMALLTKINKQASAVLATVGLLAIIVPAFAYGSSTTWPGPATLLPVLGTAAVIAAGVAGHENPVRALLSWKPAVWIGGLSYSLYLWHWPLLIVMPFVIGLAGGVATPLWAKGIVLAIALVLAHFSRRLIELPVIAFSTERMRAPRPRHRGVLVLAVAGLLVVALPAAGMYGSAAREQAAATTTVGVTIAADGTLTIPSCYGAAAMQDGADCPQVERADIVPSPVQAAADDFADTSGKGCQVEGSDTTVKGCEVGDPDGTVRLAIVGDSHAANVVPALQLIAKAHRWSLTTYLHSGCPMTRADITPSCDTWKADTLDTLQQERYDVVFVAAMSRTPWPGGMVRKADELTPAIRDRAAAAYATTWERLQQAGSTVVALRDNPDPSIGGVPDVPSCVEQSGDGDACDFSEAAGLLDDPVAHAARTTPGVRLIDPTPLFCADGTCPSVIGGVVVYRQVQHVTQTYARSMAPFLEPEVVAAVDAARTS